MRHRSPSGRSVATVLKLPQPQCTRLSAKCTTGGKRHVLKNGWSQAKTHPRKTLYKRGPSRTACVNLSQKVQRKDSRKRKAPNSRSGADGGSARSKRPEPSALSRLHESKPHGSREIGKGWLLRM